MKIPTNPLPGKCTSRRAPNEEEEKRRKAQKRLEALDYTPYVARFLSGVLRAIATGSSEQRDVRLRAFLEIARGQ